MNPIELKVARMRRNITGKEAAKALGLTIDGYFKKEHGTAKITLSEAYILTKLYQLTLTEFVNIFFNGDLPFLQDRTDNCNFSDAAYPLKEAPVCELATQRRQQPVNFTFRPLPTNSGRKAE